MNIIRFSHLKFKKGLLLIITATTEVKVGVNLEKAAQNHTANQQIFKALPVSDGKRNTKSAGYQTSARAAKKICVSSRPKIGNKTKIGRILIEKPYPFGLLKVIDPNVEEFENKELLANNKKCRILKSV